MSRTLLTAAAVLTLGATAAQAQPVHRHEERENRRERREDRREVAQDKRELADDVRDLRSFEQLAADYDSARRRGDIGALRRIDERLRRRVEAELQESAREHRAVQAEVARSAREVREERREVRRDEARGHGARQAADRRDLRDDRRDLRDDMRDAQKEREAMNRYVGMLTELNGLMGRYDPVAVERKRIIISEMIARARGEIREDKKELREDRREQREDRRETREDRRERRHHH